MNKGLLVLNGLLVIAVGYLLYVQLSSKKPASISNPVSSTTMHPNSNEPFRIAYFEMDSVEKNYELVKDIRTELNKEQETMNAELDKLGKEFLDKQNEYQAKAQTMTPAQEQSAMDDLRQRRNVLDSRKQELEQKYSAKVTSKMTEVKSKIETFLKDLNKDRTYTYIISYEPGLFYYLDTAYNITPQMLVGLNASYKKK